MEIEDLLEAWPEEHVGCVDVVLYCGDFSSLELKGKMLI